MTVPDSTLPFTGNIELRLQMVKNQQLRVVFWVKHFTGSASRHSYVHIGRVELREKPDQMAGSNTLSH